MMGTSSQLTARLLERASSVASCEPAARDNENWAMVSSFFRWAVASAAVAGVAVCSVNGQSQADQQRATFRSSADLVSIQASVRDKHGRPLPGLKASDFEVRDNGQPRSILSLRSDLRSPVSVAILVDMSGSMSVGAKIAMARQAYDSILGQLHDGDDELGVFTFDRRLHERQPFTTAISSLRNCLDEFNPFGATSLYDATAATARRLAERSAAHKAIIILTDGIDTSSSLSAPEVSAVASSIDVPVYIVATVASTDRISMTEAAERVVPSEAADLRDLADWTGGRMLFATTAGETVLAAADLLSELRQQYVLAIEASNTPEWRRLEVRVKRNSASVKARSGYFGG
jgi:VWFA-related protein